MLRRLVTPGAGAQPGFTRWLLLGLLIPVIGIAQETPAAADTPDPVNLDSDWWQYIESAGDQIAPRIDNLVSGLETRIATLPASFLSDSARTVQEIREGLARYARLSNEQQISLDPLPPVRDHYRLEDTLELARKLRDMRLESEIERDDLLDREELAKQARKRLDNHRASYLKLEQQSTEKTLGGLTIIRDRTHVALAAEELRLLKPLVAKREQQVKALDQLLKQAIANLQSSTTDTAQYTLKVAEIGDRIEQLENEAARFRLGNISLAATPDEQAESRLNQQKLIDLDVRTATARLAQTEAALSAAFSHQREAASQSGEASGLGEISQRFREQLRQYSDARIKWRRATDSERRRAESQLSLVDTSEPRLEQIHRQRTAAADETLESLAALREQLARGETVLGIVDTDRAENTGLIESLWLRLQLMLSKVWTVTASFVSDSLFTINETPVTLLGIFRVLIILAIAWWLSKFVRHGLDRVSMSSDDAMNRASLYTLGRLLHYILITIGILIGLSSIGLDFTKLALFVSALGVGLGFGLQAIFSNFVAGLIILFEKSLKVGDFVELESGVTGEVREINIRSTLITTNDNIDILVPNSEFVSGRVINWTLREAYRRIKVPFGVAYGTDKDLVRKVVLEAANGVPFTLKTVARRVPQVWLVAFGDSSLNFELVVWLLPEAVNRPSAVQAAYTWEIETALSKAGIEIPFPQRDLHLRSGFAAS